MSARSVIFDVIGRDNASHAFNSAAKSAEAAAVGMDRSIAKMNAGSLRMQAVGQRMTKALTLPLVAAAGVAVHEAVKYQKQMTLLETAGGESAKKMAVISKGLMTVARDTGTSLHDLGEGMYTVAKAGSQKWSAVDQLKILKAAAQGAKAENVDLGTATNALTSVLMSYHMGANQAVAVQNELIVGAGKAKTTMQEYAASLATVVPIASAAGISFAQIGGAIATLTQHGTSAQEATQELAFTIRNLQAPNHVAIVAMQQLGLSSVDVSKNLGKRGLTGTIDMVTNAIQKHMGPSGLVAVSAFKKSQSASADLRIEIGKMPAHLAKLSQSLLAGKTTRAEYLKAVKGMTLESSLLGRNFLVTASQALGFNNLLKSGSPAAQTFAAYLKQIMGGATGLNTALQLGGENMRYFKTASREVGAAAAKAGVDVLGWAKTQDTLAVKMDKAKANLQVLAVEVGSALIPALSKMTGWLISGMKWFDGLSGGAKKFIGYTALVVAALGPVLAITGRVGRAFAFMWAAGLGSSRFLAGIAQAELSLAGMSTKSYGAGLRLRSMFTGGISGARGMGAALAGAGIGASIGMITRSASGAEQAVGALAATALGAASGFAVGGPIGAAIGGGVGLLSNLAANFLGAGDAASKAVRPTDDFTNAIRADNDAVGINTQALVANKLEKAGLYDAGLKLGISQRTLTLAAMGNAGALAAVNAATMKAAGANGYGAKSTANMTAAQRAAVDAAAKLQGGLGGLKAILDVNTRAAKNMDAGMGKAAGSTRGAGSAAAAAGGKFQTAKGQADLLAVGLHNLAAQGRINLHIDSNAVAVAGQIADLIRQLHNIPTNMTVAINSQNRLGGILAGRATGGGAPEGWFAVGEAGPELVHKSGSTAHVYSNAQSKAIIGATGMRAPGFAAGTSKGLTGTALSNVTQGFAGLLAAVHNFLSTADDLKTAAKAMLDAARAGKDSAASLRTLAAQSARLGALGARRDSVMARLGTAPTAPTAYDRLATAQGAYDTARGSGTAVGAFDITTAGVRPQLYNDRPAAPLTASSILSDLNAKVAKAKRFSYLIRRLVQLGLPRSFVEQFVQAGPDAATQAEALIRATPGQLAAIRGDAAALDAASAQAGLAVANKFYKPGVDSAKSLVRGLLSQESQLNAAIKTLGDGMVAELRRSLHIGTSHPAAHPGSYRVGVGTHTKHAAKHAASHHGGTGTVINNHWEIHPAAKMDEHQIAAIASRRMAALVY